jgi:hypothetical protein
VTRGVIDKGLKPNSDERRAISAVLRLPPNKPLSSDAKALLWRFRLVWRGWCGRKERGVLPCLLQDFQQLTCAALMMPRHARAWRRAGLTISCDTHAHTRITGMRW